jgi:choline-sulfatase
MMSNEQPNFLVFMVDQLTSQVLKSYGGGVCKTPNLDLLADRGVVFKNAYCPYPLCAPSRFGFMAGRMPSKIAAYDNGAEFPASIPTFSHYLRLLNYYTCISGKMHFVGPDQYHGFEERLTTEIYPADFSWTPTAGFKSPDQDSQIESKVGVSTSETILDAGPMARSMQVDYDEDVVHCANREIFARARSDDQRPFMLTVSLTHPHDPYVIGQEYWDLYSDEEIDQPRVSPISLEDKDPHSKSLFFHYGMDKAEITAGAYRRARRGYYGMISYVDELFGQVMETLKVTGYAENTVIIFTSDHGDMIGERGMWFKKTLFEPAVRVPLVIAHPNRGGSVVNTPASTIDIFPTILDLAGMPPNSIQTPVDGRSLAPALNGKSVKGPIFAEHIDGGTVAPRIMIRDDDLKLTYSRAYPNQLYDLASDPDELNNLAEDLAYSDALARLIEMAEQEWSLDTLVDEVYENQTARKLVDSALQKGRQESWDFEPRSQVHNTNYVRLGDDFPEVERRGYLPYPIFDKKGDKI